MSTMPDKSVVYHADGMFSKGPDGIQVNRSCPFLSKKLLDPLWMTSFQQVRRWIMLAFQIDEATHGITLRHIVFVKNVPSARPYHMLIDIIDDDTWTAFLDVKSRSAGSFVLYAQWYVKAAPAPAPAPGVAAAPAAAGEWPTCKHGKPCTIETSWGRDPGQRFYRCRLFTDASKDCGFTQWLDEEFPVNATKHINRLLSSVECLEQQVDNLQEEIDELRRRYVTGRAAPRDSQDSDPRPRQVRRLDRDN